MPKTDDADKLNALNHSLAGVENELLRRKVDDLEADVDTLIGNAEKIAAAGSVEVVPCESPADCDDEPAGT